MAKVQRVVTGEDAQGNETYEYQFGANVDGVFVPFVTKSGGYIDALVQRGKDAGGSGDDADGDADDDSPES